MKELIETRISQLYDCPERDALSWVLSLWPKPIEEAELISMAYDCNSLPEVITDESMMVLARAIERRYEVN